MEQKYIDKFHRSYSPEALTGCWIWTGWTDRDGYGFANSGLNKRMRAHRFSALIHGLDMSKPVVRHMCNNPSCVNPNHLATGTQQDNVDDMLSSKRHNCVNRKRIKTPIGIFDSFKLAAQAHGLTTVGLRYRQHQHPSDYYFLP